MAAGNVIFAVLAALVAVNFIFAEENTLDLGDFDNDQVEGRKHHKPPHKPAKNDTDKKDGTEEGTILLLFDASAKPELSSSPNSTQGPNYYLSCTKELRCRSSKRGIALKCRGTLRYSNKESSSSSPDS